MPRIPTRILLGIIAGLLLVTAGLAWRRIQSANSFFEPRTLLSRFPAEEALAMSVDVSALRAAGLLQEAKVSTEPDYKQFVEGTGFDYRRDLDSLTASFARSGTYFIARGRFDWKKLRDYAARQGGSCYQELCRVQGSRPERHISFLPLRQDALALAVSGNDLAATLLTNVRQPVTGPVPAAPAWISVPGTELRRQDALPPQMHLMLSALSSADRVVITFGPAGGSNSGTIEAQLEATCRTEADARTLTSQLRSTTAILKEALLKGQKLPDDTVATALTAGTFDQTDRRVTGHWPIGKDFIEALTNGI